MAKSNLEWEARPVEVYAEKWWKDNGFEAKLIKRYVSKSIYEVSKDGLKDTHEVPDGVTNFKRFMQQFERSWELLVTNENLKRQLRELNG